MNGGSQQVGDVTWNPVSTNGNDIIVTNHSNAAVKACFAFNSASEANGTTITAGDVGATFLSNFTAADDTQLDTGEGKTHADADSVIKTLTLTSDRPNKKLADFTAVGHVTVTISNP